MQHLDVVLRSMRIDCQGSVKTLSSGLNCFIMRFKDYCQIVINENLI